MKGKIVTRIHDERFVQALSHGVVAERACSLSQYHAGKHPKQQFLRTNHYKMPLLVWPERYESNDHTRKPMRDSLWPLLKGVYSCECLTGSPKDFKEPCIV